MDDSSSYITADADTSFGLNKEESKPDNSDIPRDIDTDEQIRRDDDDDGDDKDSDDDAADDNNDRREEECNENINGSEDKRDGQFDDTEKEGMIRDQSTLEGLKDINEKQNDLEPTIGKENITENQSESEPTAAKDDYESPVKENETADENQQINEIEEDQTDVPQTIKEDKSFHDTTLDRATTSLTDDVPKEVIESTPNTVINESSPARTTSVSSPNQNGRRNVSKACVLL